MILYWLKILLSIILGTVVIYICPTKAIRLIQEMNHDCEVNQVNFVLKMLQAQGEILKSLSLSMELVSSRR